MLRRRLAVLESEWFKGFEYSVKPLFEAWSVSTDKGHRADGFYYERFVGPDSLLENLDFLVRKRDVRILYLAAHGSATSIGCPNGVSVAVKCLAKSLAEAASRTRLDGLYLGSCLIGSARSAEAIFSASADYRQGIRWLIGYESEVDWLESSLLDIALLRHLADSGARRLSAAQSVAYLCNEVLYKFKGLADELKLHIWVRQPGTGAVIDYLQETSKDRELWIAQQIEDDYDDDGDGDETAQA